MKGDAQEFANQLEKSGAQESMQNAETSARNTNAPGATHAAQKAHEQLSELLPKDDEDENQFSSLCRGKCQSLFPKSKMAKTLSQCLGAMMGRGKTGGLGEGGIGGGGTSDDGYASPGYSPLQLPVFGPQRTRITPPPGRPSVTSFGSMREGASTASQLDEENRESISKPAEEATGAASISLQQIPEKYRSAVRKYFSQPTTKP